jgi:hypothetical protein
MHPGAAVFWRVYFSSPGRNGITGLTDTEIKRAKTAKKAYSMGDVGGLYLWIKPTGGKLWRWSYRFDGKEKLMSLGKYPDVPLALARERYAEARKLLGPGGEQVTELDGSGAWQHTNFFAAGRLLATYNTNGQHFYFNDPLGTRRAQTDYAEVLEQTCSSLPFGDAIACSGGNPNAPTEHRFTGMNRLTADARFCRQVRC